MFNIFFSMLLVQVLILGISFIYYIGKITHSDLNYLSIVFKLFKFDGIIFIVYSIFYLVYIYYQKDGIYSYMNTKIILTISLILIIFINLLKLYVLFVVRKREGDGILVLLGLSKYIHKKFQKILSGIYIFGNAIIFILLLIAVTFCRKTYIAENSNEILETYSYDRILILPSFEESNTSIIINVNDYTDQLKFTDEQLGNIELINGDGYVEKYQEVEVYESLNICTSELKEKYNIYADNISDYNNLLDLKK